MREKIKKIFIWKTVLVVLVLLILGFGFYWFEWRPSQIRKKCYETVGGSFKTDGTFKEFVAKQQFLISDDFERSYQNCLRRNGLAK